METNTAIAPEDIRLLKNAEASCRQMMGLISDILDVSRMEQKELPLKKEPSSLEKIATEYLGFLEPLRAKYGVEFKKVIEPGLPDINVDSVIINRVMANILSNSLKFTPPDGAITVSVRKIEGGQEVSIQDTGIGIPEADLVKIFEKFYQGNDLETTRKGQGVGLTFCKMAVETHGGKIWAESKKNEGSRFVIQLPG